MKTRLGFVSNSSSASFIVYLSKVNELQKQAILDAPEYAKKILGWSEDEPNYVDESWDIKIVNDKIIGETYMDNFDMREFFFAIGLSENKEFTYESDNG